MSATTLPWRDVFDQPGIEFNTTHGFTRAVEAGRIDAEFSIRGEINSRKHNPRYYDPEALPNVKNLRTWLPYDEATKLLAMGSRHPNGTLGTQQMANLLDDKRIDAHILSIKPQLNPDTEMTTAEAEKVLGRTTLLNCMQTGEIAKRFQGKSNVVSRSDVEAVAAVFDEYMSRPEAAVALGLTDEAVRRWLMRHEEVPTRPCPGLPKKQLILRSAVEAKATGRVIGDPADVDRVTVDQFAADTGVPAYIVKRWVGRAFPAQKIAGSWMIDPNDPEVRAWVQSKMTSDLPPGDWVTATEAAKMLGITPPAVYLKCRHGEFPSARKVKGVGGRGSGGKWYIDRSDLPHVPSKTPKRKVAELMPEDFSPTRTARTSTHPSWELAKSNPNRWVKVDLKEQTVRSEASSKNSSKKDLPGLWSVSKQGNEIFVSYQTKTL